MNAYFTRSCRVAIAAAHYGRGEFLFVGAAMIIYVEK